MPALLRDKCDPGMGEAVLAACSGLEMLAFWQKCTFCCRNTVYVQQNPSCFLPFSSVQMQFGVWTCYGTINCIACHANLHQRTVAGGGKAHLKGVLLK